MIPVDHRNDKSLAINWIHYVNTTLRKIFEKNSFLITSEKLCISL